MNLTHLKYIVEVERQGSITKAAAALYMGQPNLSKLIKEMENDLGVPIFRRTAKGVVPTPKGAEFLQYAKTVIAQMDKMEQLRQGGGRETFQLVYPRADYITHAVTKTLAGLPKSGYMDVKLGESDSIGAINSVAECESSLAVIRYELRQEGFFASLLSEKELHTRELLTFDSMALVGADSPLNSKGTLSDADLEDCTEVFSGDFAGISSALQKRSMRISSRRSICVCGQGNCLDILGMVPDTFMLTSPMPQPLLDRFGLRQLRYSGKNGPLRCRDVLIHRSDYQLSEIDKLFLQQLEKVTAEISAK